jgi:hypothetical protein
MAPPQPQQRTLREAVAALVAAPRDRALLGEVAGLSLPYVEQGVQYMLASVADDPRSLGQYDQFVGEFLAEKFDDSRFIVMLAGADAPGPFLARAAHNFAASSLRKTGLPRDTQGLGPGRAHDPDEPGVSCHPDPSPGQEELALAVERTTAMRWVLDELPIDERVLLKVMYACDSALDDEELRFLADRRGVASEVVRREIAARAERSEARGLELARSVDERAGYVSELRERRRRCARIIAEVDGEPTSDVAPGILELHVSDRKARGASPEWRSSQLAALDTRIAQQERLLEQEYAKLADPLHGRPNYQEAALLLGYVRIDDGAEHIKTAANTAQVDVKRLLAKVGRGFRDRGEE